MRRMLASDLDGTLLFRGVVSEENKNALMSFKDKGGVFTISTGRSFVEVKQIVDRLKVTPDFMVLNNGAFIVKGTDEIIHKECINFDILMKIYKDIEKDIETVLVQTGFESYSIISMYQKIKRKLKTLAITLMNGSRYKDERIYLKSFNDLKKYKDKEFTLMALTINKSEAEEIQKIADYINDKYGDYVVCYRNTKFLDVVPKGCSKGTGVEYVREIANLDIDNVYTIGDSWNDDSMFEITKNSFTFTYAEEELQKKTSYVVETVAECIDRYILV